MATLAEFEQAIDQLAKETLADTTPALVAELVEQICASWETFSEREKAQLLIIRLSELTGNRAAGS